MNTFLSFVIHFKTSGVPMKRVLDRIHPFRLLFLLLFLSGCTLPFALTPAPFTLDGSRWMLSSLLGEDPLTGSRITLEVAGDEISGLSGCNAYSSTMNFDPSGIFSVGEMELQAGGCTQPDGIPEQEGVYLDALKRVTRFTGGETELYLLDDTGVLLIFTRRDRTGVNPEQLQGVTWLLQSMGRYEMKQGTHITIRFNGEVMQGDAGCRGYRGVYQAEKDWISFGTFNLLGETICTNEELLAQESLFTGFLDQVNAYWVNENRLELYTADGQMLVFRVKADTE